MIIIRITLNDGRTFFINEDREGIVFTNCITGAFKYKSSLEFKVTWKLCRISTMTSNDDIFYNIKKENVCKFEFVDPYTIDIKEFDIKENEIEINKEIYVDSLTFQRLIECPIMSSHWLYDIDGNYVYKNENYDKVTKISYYNRGIIKTMISFSNWLHRYDKESWHPTYNLHHKCMLNPIIQQIYLMEYDGCHKFDFYENKLN